EFQLINRKFDQVTGKYQYFSEKIIGSEIPNNSLNRLNILSEDQFKYPDPLSGCGPTSMLNILIWYEKYGLIESMNRDSDTERYKQNLFREIDQRLNQQAGIPRAEMNGTNNYDAAMVMDALIKERSNGKLRLHTDFVDMPIELSDFLETMPNYRAGYLVVFPKNPETGTMMDAHAVTLIRVDRAGYISIGSWGLIFRGLLKKVGDQQWLIAEENENGNQVEFLVAGMMRFIPFQPE
ncbi:MAG: hypothetical protein AAF546_07815, partial [Verrucomicrobiota bacterium]